MNVARFVRRFVRDLEGSNGPRYPTTFAHARRFRQDPGRNRASATYVQ
jgi:hypothetical protein